MNKNKNTVMSGVGIGKKKKKSNYYDKYGQARAFQKRS